MARRKSRAEIAAFITANPALRFIDVALALDISTSQVTAAAKEHGLGRPNGRVVKTDEPNWAEGWGSGWGYGWCQCAAQGDNDRELTQHPAGVMYGRSVKMCNACGKVYVYEAT